MFECTAPDSRDEFLKKMVQDGIHLIYIGVFL